MDPSENDLTPVSDLSSTIQHSILAYIESLDQALPTTELPPKDWPDDCWALDAPIPIDAPDNDPDASYWLDQDVVLDAYDAMVARYFVNPIPIRILRLLAAFWRLLPDELADLIAGHMGIFMKLVFRRYHGGINWFGLAFGLVWNFGFVIMFRLNYYLCGILAYPITGPSPLWPSTWLLSPGLVIGGDETNTSVYRGRCPTETVGVQDGSAYSDLQENSLQEVIRWELGFVFFSAQFIMSVINLEGPFGFLFALSKLSEINRLVGACPLWKPHEKVSCLMHVYVAVPAFYFGIVTWSYILPTTPGSILMLVLAMMKRMQT